MCIIYTFLYPVPLYSECITGKAWGYFPNSGNPESPIRCVAPPSHPPKIPKFQHFTSLPTPFHPFPSTPSPTPPSTSFPSSIPPPPFPPKTHHYTLLYPAHSHLSPPFTTNPHKKRHTIFPLLC